jgi:hypothetical protein
LLLSVGDFTRSYSACQAMCRCNPQAP